MTPVVVVSLPRSFLYVPAVKPELFDKGVSGPADAVVIDLEDAVPVPHKDRARENVRRWLDETSRDAAAGSQVWVRVNADALEEDLDAVVHPGIDGLFLAKCSRSSLDEVSAVLDGLEPTRQVAPGSVPVVGLVESAAAVLDLAGMARHPRLLAFGVGEADLLGDLRMSRSSDSAAAIDALRMQVVLHSVAAGLAAPVAPTSTDFRDLDAFAETSRRLLDLGFRSRTAIHPGQVPVINQVFSPDEATVARALDVMARFEAAEGGVTTDEGGRLIDAAVVREAQETLSRRQMQ